MPASDDFRRQHLVWAVQHILAKPGGTVQIQGPYDAVIKGQGVSHAVHIVLSIMTVGLWVPVWFLAIITAKTPVYRVSVDEDGRLSVFDATSQREMRMATDGTLMYVQ